MRIIAGRYKGLSISWPRNIRPTRDKVREAVFNVIAGQIRGSRVLDLFAGSGSFGIEALSRGASYALFVDNSKLSTEVIEKNLKRLKAQDAGSWGLFTKDARQAIRLLCRKGERFEVVFLDPPYYKNWIRNCLKYFSIYDILPPSGLVIAEHSKKDFFTTEPGVFKLIRQLDYGDTIISIFKKDKG